MTKELTQGKFLPKTGTIHYHHVLTSFPAQEMNGLGNKLLPRACFSSNEYDLISGCYPPYYFKHSSHSRTGDRPIGGQGLCLPLYHDSYLLILLYGRKGLRE